jgi:hypothetical protein
MWEIRMKMIRDEFVDNAIAEPCPEEDLANKF